MYQVVRTVNALSAIKTMDNVCGLGWRARPIMVRTRGVGCLYFAFRDPLPVHVSIHTCLYVHTSLSIYTYMSICPCLYVCPCLYAYTVAHAYMLICLYTYK